MTVDLDDVWPDGGLRLFLSHVATRKRDVTSLREALQLRGVSAFVAHADIRPTHEWQDVIEAALGSCHAAVAYLTKTFKGSDWTDQELGFCVARKILIIPIRIDLNPYGFIAKYQALRGADKTADQLAEEIATVLISNPLTAKQMARPVIDRFVHSGSFDSARANLARLQLLPPTAWKREWIPEVRQALEENSQLRLGVETRRRPLKPRPISEAVEEIFVRVETARPRKARIVK